VFSSCANVQPTKIGMNSYTDSAIYREVAYKQAERFCQTQGLNLKVLRERKLDNQIVLDYKCLNYDSKEYQEGNNYETPDQVIINNTRITKENLQ